MEDLLPIVFGLGWSLCLLYIQFRHAGSIKKLFGLHNKYWEDKIDATDKKLLAVAGIFFIFFIFSIVKG